MLHILGMLNQLLSVHAESTVACACWINCCLCMLNQLFPVHAESTVACACWINCCMCMLNQLLPVHAESTVACACWINYCMCMLNQLLPVHAESTVACACWIMGGLINLCLTGYPLIIQRCYHSHVALCRNNLQASLMVLSPLVVFYHKLHLLEQKLPFEYR